ncbi:beta-galactosidase [Dyella solisilvae]|uniref:Beta-galactosidase n=1 Tax=Dyella solisilvae TaxID=1920168 RepID=A0A370K7V6_9GAMM|nr:beta-galactosidase family protein [Dyella solisilvae]RDI98735.1 beta-galactosidase [Dyella solisilvae]
MPSSAKRWALGLKGAAGLCLAGALAASVAGAHAAPSATVTIEGDHFVQAGKPHQIISGSMDFQRIPRAYWQDRLRKARAMGLNTITTYVYWNALEAQPGSFDFSGNNDVAAFVRLAQKEGLDVIVRPGPYVCAEWEAGGFPGWLYADPHLRVRTRDPKFLSVVDRYFQRLGKELSPLMAAHGGPIIAVQVENEYGSFGDDRAYMEEIHQALIHAGLGSNLMFTSDGADGLPHDALPGVLAVVNFGTGDAKTSFGKLKAFRAGQPLMAGEYWDGWFDQWGVPHVHTDANVQASELAWMLEQGYSVNIYMFEGGTTFGFMNGANYHDDWNDHYTPETTSYDYDAVLDEAGRPKPKFALFRDAIAKATGATPPSLPAPTAFMALPPFSLAEHASLWDNLPAPVAVDLPQSMESFGQSYGYILYRTEIAGPAAGKLYLGEVRDYATVYVDRKLVGTVDRRLKQVDLPITLDTGRHTIDVLVENTGRINYGPRLADGRAGLVDPVLLSGKELHGWQVYPLPMSAPESIHGWTTQPVVGPAFHRGHFSVSKPADTFVDVSALGKGVLWVNGRNLGRVWDIGPQQSLYLPGPWIHAGENTVVAFDLQTPDQPVLRGLTESRWSSLAAPISE